MYKPKNKIALMTYSAVLTAIALTIFMVENQIPALVPVPGVKLGLANIVTVYAMYSVGPAPAFMILIVRILLGGIFSGRIVSLLYSLCGGLLCYLAMLAMRKLLAPKQIWICSVIGAVFHNLGQILAAMAVMGTVSIIVYLPILLVSGIIAGFFTGQCAQLLVKWLGAK
ncbi:MAG: Gx transporter family protein [Oscillospiraceae bacterium]|jgi:heptaprenyl diphosphate synthase|nr:Gx transporter family protein [Oscillospiraceae bacterium]